jgi:predicted RNA-binding Zn-ribbon protein involved in translation (DUF1610 family)
VAYLIIAFSFGLAGGIVGRSKGSSFLIWFLIAFAIPIVGLAAAVLYRSERDEVRRQCPRCGNLVRLHDAMCMRCGHDLEFPDVGIEPESAAGPR